MERKGVRSPSMRLRFGRRSDPDVPLIGRVRELSYRIYKIEKFDIFLISTQDNEIEDEIEQKAIRSPSMRLRFGRRNDPMVSLLNEVNIL